MFVFAHFDFLSFSVLRLQLIILSISHEYKFEYIFVFTRRRQTEHCVLINFFFYVFHSLSLEIYFESKQFMTNE